MLLISSQLSQCLYKKFREVSHRQLQLKQQQTRKLMLKLSRRLERDRKGRGVVVLAKVVDARCVEERKFSQ
jgi:hypothetical protein